VLENLGQHLDQVLEMVELQVKGLLKQGLILQG
jgi:hypothetical protein